VTIEDCEQRVSISNIELVNHCILHAFAPACMEKELPCISAETKVSLADSPFLIFLSLTGFGKYTPILSYNLNR
jgi:hypothetical protein